MASTSLPPTTIAVAMRHHVIKQGEHLFRIARREGFLHWRTIWEAGENKRLREDRANPNVLLPGDVLVIPTREDRRVNCATDKSHTFVRTADRLTLRIALLELNDRPLATHTCTLELDTFVAADDKVTNTKGLVEWQIAPDSEFGRLNDLGASDPTGLRIEREIEFRIGHLDPVSEVSGQLARLNNLGYDAAEIPDHDLTPSDETDLQDSVQFRSAVEEFQCDHGLAVDGKCGGITQKKLLEVHGS